MENKVKIILGPNGIVFRGNGNGGKSTTNLGEAARQVPVGKPKPDAKPKPNSKPKPKSTPKPSQNTGNTSVGFLRKYFNPKTTGGKFRILGLALGLICTGMGFALMNSKKEPVPAEEYQLDREDSAKVRELSPARELKQEQFEEIVAQHVQIQAEKEKEPLIPPEDEKKIKELAKQWYQQPEDSVLLEKIIELVQKGSQQPVDSITVKKITELVQKGTQQPFDPKLEQTVKQYIQKRNENSEQLSGQKATEKPKPNVAQKPKAKSTGKSEPKSGQKSDVKSTEKSGTKSEPKSVEKPDASSEAKTVQAQKPAEKANGPETNKPFLDKNGQYTVKKGDCIWNVVEAYLVTNGKPATVSNVHKEIDRLMAIKANDFLKWESKGGVARWLIRIYTGQKITFVEKKKAA